MPKLRTTNRKGNILIGPMAGAWITKEDNMLVVRLGDTEFSRELDDEEYELSRRFVDEILFDRGTKVSSIFRSLDKQKKKKLKSKHKKKYKYPKPSTAIIE